MQEDLQGFRNSFPFLTRWTYILRILFLFILLPCQILSQTIIPANYIATLLFDGEDTFDDGEKSFPQPFIFNTTQDANNDSAIDVEDNLENFITFSIGDSLYGTGRTGLSNRGPNDQQPAVYFHIVKTQDYDVYEYWLYYADNDWLNDHEHDWEKYFVYVKDAVPVYIKISNHAFFNTYGWCELLKDDWHPQIGVDGGSHAMKTGDEDGVRIRYDGEISTNNGSLDAGDNDTIPWIIFSNDTNVLDAVPYQQSPDTFYYGDPEYFTNSNEYGDARDAPWLRDEWDNPPSVPAVNLGIDTSICLGNSIILDASSGFDSYFWSDSSTSQTITVNTTGTYFVSVTDGSCSISDTIEVIVTTMPQAGFNYNITGLSATFSDSSISAYSYSWDFGDDSSSTQQNPTHTYGSTGTYTVCLTVSNACGLDTACELLVVSGELSIFDSIAINNIQLKVHPNPFNSTTTFEILRTGNPGPLTFELHNILGERVNVMKGISSNKFIVSREGLTDGIYFYKISSVDGLITAGKLVIN
ncbi:MAG: PKD domain-containing protein [Bacteroidota bacterium]